MNWAGCYIVLSKQTSRETFSGYFEKCHLGSLCLQTLPEHFNKQLCWSLKHASTYRKYPPETETTNYILESFRTTKGEADACSHVARTIDLLTVLLVLKNKNITIFTTF